MDDYKDKIRIVWRNFPLPFHEEAQPAAEAAAKSSSRVARTKFWAYPRHPVRQPARARRVKTSTSTPRGRRHQHGQVQGRARHTSPQGPACRPTSTAVDKAGARIGTPSFFINGKLLQGAQPVRALQGSDRRGPRGQVDAARTRKTGDLATGVPRFHSSAQALRGGARLLFRRRCAHVLDLTAHVQRNMSRSPFETVFRRQLMVKAAAKAVAAAEADLPIVEEKHFRSDNAFLCLL